MTNSPKKPLFHSFTGLIIYFGKTIKPSEKDHFYQFLAKQKIPYYELENNEFELTVAEILNKLEQKYTGQKISEERTPSIMGVGEIPENILFFSGISRPKMEEYLTILRDQSYPRFQLKAAATATNQSYTFNHLISEMRQDRVVISQMITLRNLIRQGEKMINDHSKLMDESMRQKLIGEIEEAERIFPKNGEIFDLEKCQEKISSLRNLLDNL